MLGLARTGRILSRAGAVLYLAAVLTWILPLLPGVTPSRLFWLNALLAALYVIFDFTTDKGAKALPRIIASFLLGVVVFASGATTSVYTSFREGLRTAGSNRRLPYSVLVFLTIALKLALGIVFVTIVSVWAPSLIAIHNFASSALSGAILALFLWFWPLVLVAILAVFYALLFLPILVVISGLGKAHVMEKLLSQEKQQKLGYLLGQGMAFGVMLLAWGLVAFQTGLPVNWAKLPPQQVPEDLSAQKYYELGIQYKQMGWTEQARDALTRAIAAEPDNEYAVKAKRYLMTKLPRQPVSRQAEERNIQGFNQMFGGDIKAAKQTFEELIAEYPNFEWPYSNLASIYLQEKRPEQAKILLDKALQINPSYVNALRHLGEVHKLLGNLELAAECTKKIADLDADDELSQFTRPT